MTISMLSQRSFLNRRLILMMIEKLILSSTKNQVQMINILSLNQMIVSSHHLPLLVRIGPVVEETENQENENINFSQRGATDTKDNENPSVNTNSDATMLS
jgi:hypothetical protein